MSVTRQERENCVAIYLGGRITANNKSDLMAVVGEALVDGNFNIIFNFERTIFFSSAAMQAIFWALKEGELHNHSHCVRLCCVPEQTRNVLEMTGILDYVRVYETEEQAIESFEHAKVRPGP